MAAMVLFECYAGSLEVPLGGVQPLFFILFFIFLSSLSSESLYGAVCATGLSFFSVVIRGGSSYIE